MLTVIDNDMNLFNVYVLVCVQVQATVVGFLASIAAVTFGWLPEGHFKLGHAVLLCASSVATAFIASLLLGMTSSQAVSDVHSVNSFSSCLTLSEQSTLAAALLLPALTFHTKFSFDNSHQ